jgi:hypothetical protein
MNILKNVTAWLIVIAAAVLVGIWLSPILPNLLAFIALSGLAVWAINRVTAKWSC